MASVMPTLPGPGEAGSRTHCRWPVAEKVSKKTSIYGQKMPISYRGATWECHIIIPYKKSKLRINLVHLAIIIGERPNAKTLFSD